VSELELLAAQRAFARVASALEETEPVVPLAAWLREDRGISAPLRMQIYTHAYFERIHGVLREDFPRLHAALGDAGFHDLAKLYLMAHPPCSFSLRFAGAGLPAFLAEPAAELFRERWPFAVDLATLEWQIADLFDAADGPIVTRESLARVGPEHWDTLSFQLTHAARILALDWSFASPEPVSRATRVLVYRRAERVHQRELSVLEAQALELVRQGHSFGSICAALAERLHEPGAVELVVELLERWLADELFSALSLGAPSAT